jgi:hypothetical protein
MQKKIYAVIARFIRAIHVSSSALVRISRWTPRMNRGVTVVVSSLLFTTSALATDIQTDTAVLRALDKVTAQVQILRVPVGTPTTFGRLEILAKSCLARPPEETPESSVLLSVVKTVGQSKTTVFDGWMFASSPDLSAMDDPVYDIWVLACENKATSSAP